MKMNLSLSTSEREEIAKLRERIREQEAWSEEQRQAYRAEGMEKAYKEAERLACEAFARNLRARAVEIYNLEVARKAMKAAGPMTKDQKRAYNKLETLRLKLSRAPIDNATIMSARHRAYIKMVHRANAGIPLEMVAEASAA
jgi:hypothetical protein